MWSVAYRAWEKVLELLIPPRRNKERRPPPPGEEGPLLMSESPFSLTVEGDMDLDRRFLPGLRRACAAEAAVEAVITIGDSPSPSTSATV